MSAAAGADHDCHRSGEPQSTRTSNDQDSDCVDQCIRETRLRAEEEPRDERDHRNGHDTGYEPGSDAVGEALDGSAAALSLPHELDDAREQSFRPDTLGLHDERSRGVDRRSDNFAVGFFFDRNGFSGDHRFVDGTAAFEDDAIDWNFFSRADAEFVSGLHLIERNVFFYEPRQRGLA